MAQIVLGVATPHAPQLQLPLDGWLALKQKDETDKRIDFQALRAKARPGIPAELTKEVMQERITQMLANLHVLGQKLQEAKPDVIVMIGDDQYEQFKRANMPMFSVYYGSKVQLPKRFTNGKRLRKSPLWDSPKLDEIESAAEDSFLGPRERPADQELGKHLIASLRDNNFDVASSSELNPEIGLGHAFRFLYEHLLLETEIPIAPVMVNTFFPPNQPSPPRCYALGEALLNAIEAWPEKKRVAIVTSGGLSHTIIDEEIDRRTMAAISKNDGAAMRALPAERLKLGTSEILNWVTMAGCMKTMNPHTVGEYIPAYRTEAGTGCGFGFAYWSPNHG
jgi:hypothetical protein